MSFDEWASENRPTTIRARTPSARLSDVTLLMRFVEGVLPDMARELPAGAGLDDRYRYEAELDWALSGAELRRARVGSFSFVIDATEAARLLLELQTGYSIVSLFLSWFSRPYGAGVRRILSIWLRGGDQLQRTFDSNEAVHDFLRAGQDIERGRLAISQPDGTEITVMVDNRDK